MARFIHDHSARAKAPFVAVNCSAIPETILEAELFGHERGSFTGAFARREGRFARAAGGTLFLDEIGELSPSVQVKLLRVLQEGEYEPVGGDTVRADVRIVAATNKDLRAEVAATRFREDLFYRLNVIAVTAPPLRARREDIPLLVDHFLGVYCAKNNRPRLEAPREVLAVLCDYSWPGNVRELENVIERAVVLCRADKLDHRRPARRGPRGRGRGAEHHHLLRGHAPRRGGAPPHPRDPAPRPRRQVGGGPAPRDLDAHDLPQARRAGVNTRTGRTPARGHPPTGEKSGCQNGTRTGPPAPSRVTLARPRPSDPPAPGRFRRLHAGTALA